MNGAAAPVTAGKLGRRIVLHFDINKTIISKSTSGNVNNSTLAVRSVMLYSHRFATSSPN